MKKSVSGNFRANRCFPVAGVLLMGIALYQLAGIGMESQNKTNSYQQLEQLAIEKEDLKESAAEEKENPKEQFDYRKIRIDFDALKEKNEDIIGWILFDKNGISYPVLQGEDNEEYLHTMADGTDNAAGSIFMDAWCMADFTDAHTILYGHNMKDLSMFGKLKNYRLKKDYYQENRYFTIYTPTWIYRYEIFAWYEVAKEDSVYQIDFDGEETFESFVHQMIERSYEDTKLPVGKTDKIVTLSTCSSEGMRFVVHGKRIFSVQMTESVLY